MWRSAKAAIFCSLQKPLSSAAAAGVPNSAGRAAKVGSASALSLAWLDKLHATIKRWSWSTATCALYACSKPALLEHFMMRDSGSVKLYWSLACGSADGGVGGRPRGLRPEALGFGLPLALLGFVLSLLGRLPFLSARPGALSWPRPVGPSVPGARRSRRPRSSLQARRGGRLVRPTETTASTSARRCVSSSSRRL